MLMWFKKLQRLRWVLYLKYTRLIIKWVFTRKNYIHNIGGSDTLPPPLSHEEERDLLAKLSLGDTSVRTALIERNLRLVVYIARKFENTGINIEDLFSIGVIGLIKAINSYDPTKNIKLATYASRCIENEILMYLRKNSRIKLVSLDEPINIDDKDGNRLLLSDVLGTDNDVVHKGIENETDKKLLTQAMYRLSPKERTVIQLRYGLVDGDEKTQKQVGVLCDMSQSYVSRLEANAKNKIKNILRDELNDTYVRKIKKTSGAGG